MQFRYEPVFSVLFFGVSILACASADPVVVTDVGDVGDVSALGIEVVNFPEVAPSDVETSDLSTQEIEETVPETSGTDLETTSCAPDCEGKQCGDDGCGESCGSCTDAQICGDGLCQCAQANQVGEQCDACAPGYVGSDCADLCTSNGFPVAEAEAWHDSDLNQARYQAFSSPSFPREMLAMHIYYGAPRFGPSGVGTYDITGSSFADCGLCLMAETDCHDFLCLNCDRHFFADEGLVHVESFWGEDGVFSVTFDGVVFREVAIDMNTFDSNVIPGGAVWCMDGFTFSCVNGLCALEP